MTNLYRTHYIVVLFKYGTMAKYDTLQTYHTIFNEIREMPRYRSKRIAHALGLSGRGHAYAIASRYINKLYDEKYSLRPNLVLRNFENCYTNAYFLKVVNPRHQTSSYLELIENSDITYMLFLGGKYDFFVTSKKELEFDEKLSLEKESILYNPIYTIPKGWEKDVNDQLRKIASLHLEKGSIERELEDFLFWDKIQWDIYNIMRTNIQKTFLDVGKCLNVAPNTVRKYFNADILPNCDIAHYFFPKGYDHYLQSLVVLKTDYEIGFVKSLHKLPCTSYIFPLEDELAIVMFHEGVNDLMFMLKKFEEKGFIDYHFLLVPIQWEYL